MFFIVVTNFTHNLGQYHLVRLIAMYVIKRHCSFQICWHIHPKSFDAGLSVVWWAATGNNTPCRVLGANSGPSAWQACDLTTRPGELIISGKRLLDSQLYICMYIYIWRISKLANIACIYNCRGKHNCNNWIKLQTNQFTYGFFR